MNVRSQLRSAVVGAFGRGATVRVVQRPSPRIVRIVLSVPSLRDRAFAAGDKIKIDVGEGFRSYTPACIDSAERLLHILVHAHGDSAGSRWARSVAAGDEVRFVGPARSLDGAVGDAPWIAFFGDETALGLAEMVARGRPSGVPMYGAIEMHHEDCVAAEQLPIPAIPRDGAHGGALLERLASHPLPNTDGVAILSGEAGSVLALRQALLDAGLTRSQLRIKPYWSLRGTAHRKELERTVLRA